jgi:plastocyanin
MIDVVYQAKKLLLVVGLLLAAYVLAGSTSTYAHSTADNHGETVILNDKGFNPREITVTKGSTITWKIEGKDPHWPAADVHPSHQAYPGAGGCIGSKLDACRALKAGEAYEFEFDQVGKWTMHDHLYPEFTMTVEVVNGPGGVSASLGQRIAMAINDILIMLKLKREPTSQERHLTLFSKAQKKQLAKINTDTEPRQAASILVETCKDRREWKFRDVLHCYSEAMYQVATVQTDTNRSFSIIQALQSQDRAAAGCHIIAHGIGWATYDKDPANWKKNVSQMNSACSYGGVHGVIEQYSASGNGNIKKSEVASVCGDRPSWGCLHGMGHVLLVQAGNDIEKAIDLCGAIEKEGRRHHCLNGVYMEHMIAQNLYEHGLASEERRRYWYQGFEEFEKMCRAATGEGALSCWKEIIHAAAMHFDADAPKVFNFCETAQNQEAAKLCRRHALDDVVSRKHYDLIGSKYMCGLAPAYDVDFKKYCLRNLAMGAISNLPPGPTNPAMGYCKVIENEYKEDCYQAIGAALGNLKLGVQARARICANVPADYRNNCANGGRRSAR